MIAAAVSLAVFDMNYDLNSPYMPEHTRTNGLRGNPRGVLVIVLVIIWDAVITNTVRDATCEVVFESGLHIMPAVVSSPAKLLSKVLYAKIEHWGVIGTVCIGLLAIAVSCMSCQMSQSSKHFMHRWGSSLRDLE